jgi:hypothetical protein
LTAAGLERLRGALERDDKRVIQGNTMRPQVLQCTFNDPVEACCPLCWALLDTKSQPHYVSVGPLEERFADALLKASDKLGWPMAAQVFLSWVDEAPRDEMRRQLIAEVNRELARRAAEATPSHVRVA